MKSKRQDLVTVIEKLKQKLLAKATMIKRYGNRIAKYRKNRQRCNTGCKIE